MQRTANNKMNGDIYVRDGSRFKKVPNMVGMYYNGIIFTKEQMQDTIGDVVDQKYDHIVICAIIPSEFPMQWSDTKQWCERQFEGKGRMPEIDELIIARKFINKLPIWVWSKTEYGLRGARSLGLKLDSIYTMPKDDKYHVFAFLDIPIINIM